MSAQKNLFRSFLDALIGARQRQADNFVAQHRMLMGEKPSARRSGE